MSTLIIREFTHAVETADGGGKVIPIPQEPGKDQNITLSASSQQSAALGTYTRIVTLIADVGFCYTVGDNPTVVAATNLRIPADTLWSFGVHPGQKIAVIAA
jgi:hypothetical protein